MSDDSLNPNDDRANQDGQDWQLSEIDPNGPPVPVAPRKKRRPLLKTGVISLVGGAGLFALILPSTQAARGSTRSSRLIWEKRQAEIDQAIQDCSSQDAAATNSDEQGQGEHGPAGAGN